MIGDPRNMRAYFCENIVKKYPNLNVICCCHKNFSPGGYWYHILIKWLKKTKVVANIHFYPLASLETHRISQSLMWQISVVSEKSKDKTLDVYYQKRYGIVFTDYIENNQTLDKFIDNVKDLVDNKEQRYNNAKLAYKTIVKINNQKNKRVCRIVNRIQCH